MKSQISYILEYQQKFYKEKKYKAINLIVEDNKIFETKSKRKTKKTEET
ncbi:MAG: hypothetical protein ACK5HR_01400 [Mycoplasmatales bacterium]